MGTRYGRQLIVPQIGLKGQQAISNARVLIIGAGGLGCPAIAYLAGAGIGTLGIVDGDDIELSNLHRQILHTQIGLNKAKSAKEYVHKLNPEVKVEVFAFYFTSANAAQIIADFDLVLDCTDRVQTRYLVNDACVCFKKPFVSAAALKTEGQLAVYNAGSNSPCYRCLFPKPPPPKLIGTCGDAGVLGPVVGVMGVYQACEALRLVVSGLQNENPNALSIFSLFAFPQWRQVRVRGKQSDCKACGLNPNVDLTSFDYDLFCGEVVYEKPEYKRITAEEFKSLGECTVVDVRTKTQFEIVSLGGSINIPIDEFRRMEQFEFSGKVVVVCRYGNDSVEAANKLCRRGVDATDVVGGVEAMGLRCEIERSEIEHRTPSTERSEVRYRTK